MAPSRSLGSSPLDVAPSRNRIGATSPARGSRSACSAERICRTLPIQGIQVMLTPLLRLNVEEVQNAAEFLYQTW